MAFTLEQFARVRPFLYHLTAEQNLARIQRTSRLQSATALMTAAGEERLLTSRRRAAHVVSVNNEMIHIRDQAPLHEGNIRFGDGWSLPQLIDDLNRRVFFWPGGEDGPISYGVRHFERYRVENPVVLRVSFREVLGCNSDTTPSFCKFNSGSPRCSGGLGSLRCRDTFMSADRATFPPSGVVEVTFLNRVNLPSDMLVAAAPDGPWRTT